MPGFALALVSRYNKTRASHKADRNLSFLPRKGRFKTVSFSRIRRGRADFTRQKKIHWRVQVMVSPLCHRPCCSEQGNQQGLLLGTGQRTGTINSVQFSVLLSFLKTWIMGTQEIWLMIHRWVAYQNLLEKWVPTHWAWCNKTEMEILAKALEKTFQATYM